MDVEERSPPFDEQYERISAKIGQQRADADERWRTDLYEALCQAFSTDRVRYRERVLPLLAASPELWDRPLSRRGDDRAIMPFTPNVIYLGEHSESPSCLYDLATRAEPLYGLCIESWSYDESSQEPPIDVTGREIVEVLGEAPLEALEALDISFARSVTVYVDGRDRRFSIGLEREDLAALARCSFPALRRLRLSNDLQLSMIEPLAEAHLWTSLEELDLSGNALGPNAIQALFARPMPALRALALRNNPIDDRGAERLAKASTLPALERLALEGCGVSTTAERALRGSETLVSLRDVRI